MISGEGPWGPSYAANSSAGCADAFAIRDASGRIRTTTPPVGGPGETGRRRISLGSHNFGITQQFTAQNPANTKLILTTPCCHSTASGPSIAEANFDPENSDAVA